MGFYYSPIFLRGLFLVKNQSTNQPTNLSNPNPPGGEGGTFYILESFAPTARRLYCTYIQYIHMFFLGNGWIYIYILYGFMYGYVTEFLYGVYIYVDWKEWPRDSLKVKCKNFWFNIFYIFLFELEEKAKEGRTRG